ncbi:MAG: AAA family ATPase [Sulfuricaulis sp.]|nr:AAA family ATPase [Sulfuricaulis sp.]
MDIKLPPLIQALHNAACYNHAVQDIHVVETHISWVVLTGPYAYKIKKPVNLGFLDFSALDKRRFYCEEELRLNRRLAEALYLGVIPITGSPASPRLNGSGAAIEYAVKMVQFSEEARLDRMLARGELQPMHIDLLAQELAAFHGRIASAGHDQAFGDPEHVHEPVRQNFEQIRPRIEARDQVQLRRLEIWSELSFAELKKIFAARKHRGFIRECHGDAHLANMVWRDDRVVLFDCLEFNENLRWIDTLSELAFVTMDLDDRARPDLARRALNSYLEHTGDYEGIAVFRFYQVYRALVRAKVACIRSSQSGLSAAEKQKVRAEYLGYAQLAERYTQSPQATLIVTHGFSGSGKTWLSQQLLANLGAIRLRSDVERKRLHGLAPQARSGSNIDDGIYTATAGRRTYARLAELAQTILRAGYPVIVDAAFLKREQRAQLRAAAEQARAPFVILDIRAPDNILRERLRQRARQNQEVSEADLAVLDRQLATQEPLTADEQAATLIVDSGISPDITALVQKLRALTAAG